MLVIDTRVIGTLVPGKNAGPVVRDILKHNIQLVLKVEKKQDIWIQLMQDTTTLKENSMVALGLFKPTGRSKVPKKKLNMRRKPKTLKYVAPVIDNGTRVRVAKYVHNGFCFQLDPGSYFVFAGFCVAQERAFMIRVIGEGVTLTTLT